MNGIFKKIVSAVCAICLLPVPVSAPAEDSAIVRVGSASSYAGYSVSVDVTAENLENLGAIDVDVFYDAEALVLDSAVQGALPGTFDINSDTEGTVRLSAAFPEGINGTATLMTLNFTVSSEAKTGEYPINVAIGDAFNTDLEAISVLRSGGAVTVIEKPVSVPTARFYCSASKSSAEIGEEVTLTYYSYTLHSMAGGVFEISYDETLFEFVDLSLCEGMKTSDGMIAVNSDNPGYIKAVYNSSEAVGTGDLFSVTLRVIKDTDAASSIKMTASSLYAQDLSIINGNERNTAISITKKASSPDIPEPESKSFSVFVPEETSEGEEFEAVVVLSGDSALAAGDFTISYNTEELICVSAKVHSDVSENGGMGMLNKNISEGTIKFSYINENGVSATQRIVTIIFKPAKTGTYTAQIGCSGSGLRDVDFKVVELVFVPAQVKVKGAFAESIAIENLPDKTEYYVGENFDVSGGKICVNYSDGTNKIIDMTEEMISGFENGTTGKKAVMVSYEDKTAGFEVRIISKIFGDVNFDERVNIADANLIRRNAVKLIDFTPYQLAAADVNGDGKINIADANLVRRYAAKLIDSFPVDG